MPWGSAKHLEPAALLARYPVATTPRRPPPPGYGGCGEFAAEERAKCQVVAAAVRRLQAPAGTGVRAKVQRRLDRRRARSPYAAAVSRSFAWEAWSARPAPGSGCTVAPEHRAACEKRRAAERAQKAAREAADPQIQFFKRYSASR